VHSISFSLMHLSIRIYFIPLLYMFSYWLAFKWWLINSIWRSKFLCLIKCLNSACSSFQVMCTNVKDFTSCLCDLWMMNCLYFLSKEIIIHLLLSCAINISWVFSISLKGKRVNYKGRTLKWKRKTSRATTSTWIWDLQNIQWCGCKHSKTFHYESTRQKLFITNLLSLDRDK
jgi:hypothetical protein